MNHHNHLVNYPESVWKWKSLSCVWLFGISWIVQLTKLLCPRNSPEPTGVGCHSLLQGIPDPETESWFPALRADSFLSEPPGKPAQKLRIAGPLLITVLAFLTTGIWVSADTQRLEGPALRLMMKFNFSIVLCLLQAWNPKYLAHKREQWGYTSLSSPECVLAEVLYAKGNSLISIWSSFSKEKNSCQENVKEEKSKQWHLKWSMPKWC